LQLPDFASYFQPEIEPEWAETNDGADLEYSFCLRILVDDSPGVFGKLGTLFGAQRVSFHTVLQRGGANNQATIVVLTHDVRNGDMERALAELKRMDFLKSLESCIRLYKPISKNAG
jgi:homoserine dehydrogenase